MPNNNRSQDIPCSIRNSPCQCPIQGSSLPKEDMLFLFPKSPNTSPFMLICVRPIFVSVPILPQARHPITRLGLLLLLPLPNLLMDIPRPPVSPPLALG